MDFIPLLQSSAVKEHRQTYYIITYPNKERRGRLKFIWSVLISYRISLSSVLTDITNGPEPEEASPLKQEPGGMGASTVLSAMLMRGLL